MDEYFELWLEAYLDSKNLTPGDISEEEHDLFYDAFRAGWEYRRLLER